MGHVQVSGFCIYSAHYLPYLLSMIYSCFISTKINQRPLAYDTCPTSSGLRGRLYWGGAYIRNNTVHFRGMSTKKPRSHLSAVDVQFPVIPP